MDRVTQHLQVGPDGMLNDSVPLNLNGSDTAVQVTIELTSKGSHSSYNCESWLEELPDWRQGEFVR